MKMIFTKRTDDEKRREDERLEAFKEWLHGELTEQRTKLVRGVAAVLSDRFARTEPDPQPKEADETRQVEEQEITPDLFAQLEPVEPIEEEAVEVETKDAKGRVNWRAYGIKNGNVKAGVAARLESLCDGDTSFLYGHKALDYDRDHIVAVIREHERSVEKGCAVVHLASNFSIRKVAPNLDMTPCSIGAVYAWLLERGCDVETLDVFFRDFVTSTDAYNPAVVLRGRIERKEISSGDMTAEFARASGVRMTESVEAVRRDLLTAREAAEYTGYAESTIQSAAHCGDLAVADTGVRGARLFERSVLDAWKRKLNGTPQRCPRKRGKKGVAREVLS